MRSVSGRVMVIFGLLAFATLVQGWSEAGWPANHEATAFGQRTWIYARHLSWFDILPIWSSADASGFGSPMPIAYHKLFYLFTGPLALAIGSTKPAIVLVLTLLLIAGAVGMYLTLRTLGASTLTSTVAGCALLTANYTVSNWLVRGAMAEFAASMVAVWVLLFFAKSLPAGRLHVGLGVALGLMWLGHSVLAFYTVLALAATTLLLAAGRIVPWSLLRPSNWWRAAAALVAIVLPFLVPLAIVGQRYDFARIIAPPWRPAYQFRPAMSYIWDIWWTPVGRRRFGLTLQLDHAVIVLLAVAIVVLAIRSGVEDRRNRLEHLKRAAPFLLLASICLMLQFRFAAPVYELVPGGAFIQFPWRLLAIVTPTLILAAFYLADAVFAGETRAFVLGAAAAWMIVACVAFGPTNPRRLQLDPPVLTDISFSALREYEPKVARALPTINLLLRQRWAEAGCSYQVESGGGEIPEVRYGVECSRGAVLPLPVYASPLHLVRGSRYARSYRCVPLSDPAGVCGAFVPAGSSTITVSLPSFASLPRWAWEQMFGTATAGVPASE